MSNTNLIDYSAQLFAASTIPQTLVQKAWALQTWKAAKNDLFFDKFMGTTPNNIIQELNDLQKQKGDNITVPLLLKLAGDGVTGDNKLEGNEEALQYRDFNMTINQLRNGVVLAGRFEEQKSQLKMRQDAQSALQTWLAETVDKKIFTALSASPSADRTVYGGTAVTAANKITSAATMNTDLISLAKRKAMNSAASGLPKIRPVNVKGKSYYVLVIDLFQSRDLKKDDKWLNAQKDANIRGEDNPIFTGALGVWDGVVLHESEQVVREGTGDTGTMVGHGLFLGAQAGILASAVDTRWDEDEFDYGNQHGFSISRIFGVAKAKYKIPNTLDATPATDFAAINILTSSVAD